MRVESMSSRLDFDERRARALEGVVQYRPGRGAAARAAGRSSGRRADGGDTAERAERRGRRRRRRPADGAADAAPRSGAGAAPDRPAMRRQTGASAAAPASDGRHARSTAADAGRRPGARSPARRRSETGGCGEARGRRSALRRRHQRRRRAARALHRRAPRAARRGRGPHHVRARLRHVAQRAARRRRGGQRRPGAPVPRASASATRSTFGRRSRRVFERAHSVADELAWLDDEGPTSPALIDVPRRRTAATSTSSSSSATATTTRITARAAVPRRRSSCRRPSATRRSASSIFGPIFRGVRALMYNSPEERAMINAAAGNQDVPGVVVGVGSDVPAQTGRRRASARSSTSRGRLRSTSAASTRTRAARSCSTSSSATRASFPGGLDLVLIGSAILPMPEHPRIRHLGFLADEDKFDAMAAADLLIMPSYFESLSMVALEAWALGRPVLANGRCDVLQGPVHPQQARACTTRASRSSPRRCRARVERAAARAARAATAASTSATHYAWPVIERKYLDMFERLEARRRPGRRADGAAARMVRAAPARPAAAPSDVLAGSRPVAALAIRQRSTVASAAAAVSAMSAPPARPPGARHARLRRRHRPRGARHPARAARRGLRVGHLRRDRRPAPRGSDASTTASWSTPVDPTTS